MPYFGLVKSVSIPKMVRLKVLYLCIVNDREDSFNSKNGAIKSQIIQYHQVADHVSIPKMVRLKAASSRHKCNSISMIYIFILV